MVAESQQAKRARALVALLSEIADGHAQLLAAIDGKIVAMKTGQAQLIRDATAREQAIVERINEREGLRRSLTENIAGGYGVGKAAAAKMNASRLAQRLGEPYQTQIIEAANRLRVLTAQIARRNHVARMISTNVIRHVNHVMDAFSGRQHSTGYSHAGGIASGVRRAIFDALG